MGDWNNPQFEFGPADFEFEIEGYPATIADLTVAGDFTPDGNWIVEGTMDGVFDTRFLDGLIDPGGSEGAGCELLGSLGIECVACPGDGELFRLHVRTIGFQAERVDTP